MSVADKEFYNLTISINKALNAMEAPLKIKHARSVIITTHRTKEAKSFWAVVTRQPLMEHRFTAWKFCHLLHKVLREGHPNTLRHSQTHKKMILEMGKLWGHLQDGVGNCIQAYSKLLITKLEFHDKNAIFPGSLTIDFAQIENYAGDDINVYFQMGVEIFDYLDDIIDVQSTVFVSINAYRMSSMTPQGQCRLAPLITLIQDSNPLYDLCVRIMFKLHDQLPNDVLKGHRDRFREIFTKLKYFYDNVRPLQYFADLIQVPHMPETAPDFSSRVDFTNYTPPVVYVQPEPEPVMDNLVDMSLLDEPIGNETHEQNHEVARLEKAIEDREYTIGELRSEMTMLRNEVVSMERNYHKEFEQLRDENMALNSELLATKETCRNLQVVKENLEVELANLPVLLEKATAEKEKFTTSEEKFSKLKVMYTQIRDEHINLLRQHGDSTKLLNKIKTENAEIQTEFEKLKLQHKELEESIQTNSSYNIVLANKNDELQTQLNAAIEKHEKLTKVIDENRQTIALLSSKSTEESTELTRKNMELVETVANVESLKAKVNELEHLLTATKIALQRENDVANSLRTTHATQINGKEDEIKEISQKLSNVETQLQQKEFVLGNVTKEKLCKENELQDLLQQNVELEKNVKAFMLQVDALNVAKFENEKMHKQNVQQLWNSILGTLQKLSAQKLNQNEPQVYERSLLSMKDLLNVLDSLRVLHQSENDSEREPNGLLQKLTNETILLCLNFISLHEQLITICNSSSEIEKSEVIYNQLMSLKEPIISIFDMLRHADKQKEIETHLETIKTKLLELRRLTDDLVNSNVSNLDLEYLVDKELKEMDQVIEEAATRFAEMLSNARSRDDGIKLEVNEKILDACTALMKCIKMLIQRSKTLQEEIVSTGRGNTSVKEFYKRNSQWTEGLLSASKSVAKGANLLVEAANKAVINESSSNFEIIVAATEIAACTAQLVIASKVKAKNNSKNLQELTNASRNVSKATGAVVATVKSCNTQLEQLQEVDVSKLTASQAKTMEMDIHVKVLELEQALQLERLKLASFRRNNYQNTEN